MFRYRPHALAVLALTAGQTAAFQTPKPPFQATKPTTNPKIGVLDVSFVERSLEEPETFFAPAKSFEENSFDKKNDTDKTHENLFSKLGGIACKYDLEKRLQEGVAYESTSMKPSAESAMAPAGPRYTTSTSANSQEPALARGQIALSVANKYAARASTKNTSTQSSAEPATAGQELSAAVGRLREGVTFKSTSMKSFAESAAAAQELSAAVGQEQLSIEVVEEEAEASAMEQELLASSAPALDPLKASKVGEEHLAIVGQEQSNSVKHELSASSAPEVDSPKVSSNVGKEQSAAVGQEQASNARALYFANFAKASSVGEEQVAAVGKEQAASNALALNSPKVSNVGEKQSVVAGQEQAALNSFDLSKISNVLSPTESFEALVQKGEFNAASRPEKILFSAALGGCYVGMGAMVSLAVAGNSPELAAANPGLDKFIFAALFPMNLLLAQQCGGSLYTGNTANMMAAFCEGRVTLQDMGRTLGLSWVGNLVGCSLFAVACKYAGVLEGGAGVLAAATLATKTSCALGPLLVKAMFCNWLVCLAVLLSTQAKDMGGKYISIWLPVSTFVSIGFEHSVANMFLLPAGLMSQHDITLPTALFHNLIPVSIGNAFSGALLVGATMSYLFGSLGKEDNSFSLTLKRLLEQLPKADVDARVARSE